MGEYAYVKEDMDIEEILEKVTLLLGRRFEESDTHGWVVTAITKLVSQLGHMPESVQNQVALYLTSTNTDIQQVTQEISEILHVHNSISMVLHVLNFVILHTCVYICTVDIIDNNYNKYM